MKLINREYAIATACSGLVRRIEGCDFRKVEDVRESLIKVPTVDAIPVRHGKWIDTFGDYIKYGTCSLCGDMWENIDTMNYCPNCGAKMDAEQEKQND